MNSPVNQRSIERNSAEMLIIALLGMLVLLVAIPLFQDVHSDLPEFSSKTGVKTASSSLN